jgi:SAM-dependent methyltransferase
MSSHYDEVWREVYGDMQDQGPVHRHMRRLLARLLAGLEYADALEVGCGAGHNFALLGDVPIAGADTSAEALRRARERAAPGTELFELDIEHEKLPRTWELVFCALVLEHTDDDVAALRNICAMSRKHIVLCTIAGSYERYRAFERHLGHVRNYGAGELERKLESAGAQIQSSSRWGFPFYSPLTRLAQLRWRPQPRFGRSTAALASALHALYRLNLPNRGDLLIVHATHIPQSSTSPSGASSPSL